MNKADKYFPKFSVYQVFLYSLSAILVVISDKKIADYFNLGNYSTSQNLESFIFPSISSGQIKSIIIVTTNVMGFLLFITVLFSVFLISLLSILRHKELKKLEAWLCFFVTGSYSVIIGILAVGYQVDRMFIDNFFDMLLLAYYTFLVFHGIYIIAMIQAQAKIPENVVVLKGKISLIYLALSVAIVSAWTIYGLLFIEIEWYLVVALSFLIISVIEYIKQLLIKQKNT